MTSRERVIRALEFTTPDRIPRNLWTVAGIGMFRKQDLNGVLALYSEDILVPDKIYGIGLPDPTENIKTVFET